MALSDEIKTKIAPHKGAIFFFKSFGAFPGGDPNEIFAIARSLGMGDNEIKLGCSGCFNNALNLIFEHLNENDPQDYINWKQLKGI